MLVRSVDASDAAHVVLRYLRDAAFDNAANAFEADASHLLASRTDQGTQPKLLLTVLNEYVLLKAQAQQRAAFERAYGDAPEPRDTLRKLQLLLDDYVHARSNGAEPLERADGTSAATGGIAAPPAAVAPRIPTAAAPLAAPLPTPPPACAAAATAAAATAAAALAPAHASSSRKRKTTQPRTRVVMESGTSSYHASSRALFGRRSADSHVAAEARGFENEPFEAPTEEAAALGERIARHINTGGDERGISEIVNSLLGEPEVQAMVPL